MSRNDCTIRHTVSHSNVTDNHISDTDRDDKNGERVPLMDELDRRERMREAALKRFNKHAEEGGSVAVG